MVDAPLPRSAKLYSPGQILVACFLAGPLAASWPIAANFRAFGERARARLAWICGLAGALIAGFIGSVLPESIPGPAWPALYSAGVYALAAHLFGSPFERHLAQGGSRRSWWKVAGIVVAFIAAFSAAYYLYLRTV